MRIRLLAAVLTLGLIGAACGSDDNPTGEPSGSAAQAGDGLRVAFIYDGAIDDGGWNSAHRAGAQYLQDHLPGAEITHVENIAPGDQARATLEDLATQGYDLIVGTTFYHDDVFAVAPDFPDVKFVSWATYETADNIGGYDAASEEGRYLDGIIAGSVTKSNIIGYPAGFPIPEAVRSIDTFTLGARSVNPDVKVIPVYVNSWYDPPKEREAAQSLVDAGADVLVHELNSPAVASVAVKSGIYHMGYGWDQSARGPDSWLGSFTFNWGPYYLSQAQAILDGTWKPELYYGGIAADIIDEAPTGPAVPQSATDLVTKIRGEIADGTFDIFGGPITDNKGEVKIPEGGSVQFDERVTCCDWYVQGIQGDVPAS